MTEYKASIVPLDDNTQTWVDEQEKPIRLMPLRRVRAAWWQLAKSYEKGGLRIAPLNALGCVWGMFLRPYDAEYLQRDGFV